MQKLLVVLFSAGALAATAHAEVTWNGSNAIRTITQTYDDGMSSVDAAGKNTSKITKKRWELQASFGGFGKGDMVDWGLEMRIPGATPNSTWVAFNQDADFTPRFSQAYGRIHGKVLDGDYGVTVGRQKPVFVFDPIGQCLFANAVRWDGFGWSYKHGMFGFNMAQYVQGATSGGTAGASTYNKTDSSDSNADTQSHFAVLYAFQPTVTFNITDDIKSMFAVGYYNYDGTEAKSTAGFFQNNIHGGAQGQNPVLNTITTNVNPVIMDNPKQWQFLSDTNLPYNLRFVAEYVLNKKTNYGTRGSGQLGAADRSALGLSLAYGQIKKAGDFALAYAYTNKGIASVITAYSNVDIGADNVSHMFQGQYMIEDHLWFTTKVQWHKEKAGLDGNGLADSPALQKQQRWSIELTAAY